MGNRKHNFFFWLFKAKKTLLFIKLIQLSCFKTNCPDFSENLNVLVSSLGLFEVCMLGAVHLVS